MRLASFTSLVSLVLGLTACINQRAADITPNFPPALRETEDTGRLINNKVASGEVKIDGSSTVFPISQVMATKFQKQNPGVRVTVSISGTGGGFKKFCVGETDITGASRPINAAEMALCQKNNIQYIELPIAFDGISVVVNTQNNFVECLKVTELQKMWEPTAQGKVTNWNQIRSNFPNQPLQLYGPDRASGTYDYFTFAVVGEQGKSRSDYIASKDDNNLVQGVATNQNALGFFGYSYYLGNRNKLKLVAIDNGYGCLKPSPQTIADGSYQPLSRPVFIYVNKSAASRPEVNSLTNFYLAPENANLVLQIGDVPLPNIALEAASIRFKERLTGTQFGGRGSVIGIGKEALQ